MDERSRRVRYRGYRPPPLWWFKLKYAFGAAVSALCAIFALFQLLRSFLTGKIAVAFSRTDAVVAWSDAPSRFLGQLFLWSIFAMLGVGLAYALIAAFKRLNGPSAETRL